MCKGNSKWCLQGREVLDKASLVQGHGSPIFGRCFSLGDQVELSIDAH